MHAGWSDGLFASVMRPKSASSSGSGGPLSIEDRGKNCALNAEQWAEGSKFLLLDLSYFTFLSHQTYISSNYGEFPLK